MGSDSFDFKRYITNPELIFEGFSRIGSGYSTYQKKDQFRMKVITSPRKLEGSSNPEIYAFKGRIIDEYSPHSLLPDPCDATVASNVEYVKAIASLHTTVLAYQDPGVAIGTLIDVTMEPGDGLSIYNLQYCRFLRIAAYKEADLQVSADCYELSQLSFAQGDFLGDVLTMRLPTEYSAEARFLALGGKTTANDIYERLTELLEGSPLFSQIRAGEGGNNYAVYNAGVNENLVSTNTAGAIRDSAKPPITELSVAQISLIQNAPSEVDIDGRRSDYRLNKNGEPQTPRAVGAYQFMPATLKSIIGYFIPLADRENFDKQTQDMFAVVSMMNKRPALGNYLLGRDKDNNAVEDNDSNLNNAYEQIALEWAFFQAGPDPDTGEAYKQGSLGTLGDSPLPSQNLQLTDSIYTGINNNRGESYTYGNAKKDLRKARQSIVGNQDLQQLLEEYYNFKTQLDNQANGTTTEEAQTASNADASSTGGDLSGAGGGGRFGTPSDANQVDY